MMVSLLAMIYLREILARVQFVRTGEIILSGVVTYFSGIAQAQSPLLR